MATTWIIAADSSRARILQVLDREQRLSEVEDLLNPGGRVHDRDLIADAHPRFRGTSGPGSDREEPTAVDHEVELFAKRLSDYLDKARTAHRYDRLHLIAPPKFLGQLRKELDKEVQKLVTAEIPKDLSWLNARDLERKYFSPRSKDEGAKTDSKAASE
jgi:protein required for attachment to host cells